ncbi:hypothetical protein SLEP1_g39132 [Rubroshorea leprosula]|uniref:Uncharacterized protein n=1 Tax=Rubroshorea leprosula TaxID=152421 RepID=A0AAV5KZ86_9ROSI|nr:hypothetical protein SLEP1_g39132 [Rubroshorea leprosula]
MLNISKTTIIHSSFYQWQFLPLSLPSPISQSTTIEVVPLPPLNDIKCPTAEIKFLD